MAEAVVLRVGAAGSLGEHLHGADDRGGHGLDRDPDAHAWDTLDAWGLRGYGGRGGRKAGDCDADADAGLRGTGNCDVFGDQYRRNAGSFDGRRERDFDRDERAHAMPAFGWSGRSGAWRGT